MVFMVYSLDLKMAQQSKQRKKNTIKTTFVHRQVISLQHTFYWCPLFFVLYILIHHSLKLLALGRWYKVLLSRTNPKSKSLAQLYSIITNHS